MKLIGAVLGLLMLVTPAFSKEKQNLGDNLRKATIAVYHGVQECKDYPYPGIFGETEVQWSCKFKSDFTCTATITGRDRYHYSGLTAGHCFDWKKKNEYYISDTVGLHPVLHKIDIVKFENDERYDFAIINFESFREYPTIGVDTESTGVVTDKEIINVNFALGLVKQTTHGLLVSGEIASPALAGDEDLKGRYLVNIGVGPGASGSAVVDVKTGLIIGLVEAVFPRTQMPTVVIPTGVTLMNFIEDDSAGLEPKVPPVVAVPVKKEASLWQKFLSWI